MVARGVSLTDIGVMIPGSLGWNATDVNTMPAFDSLNGNTWNGPNRKTL
jgi:hypothetical protein